MLDVSLQLVTGILGKENPSSPNRSRTYDLPITSSDALPLSYRRLVGAGRHVIRRSFRTSQRVLMLFADKCEGLSYAELKRLQGNTKRFTHVL